MFNFVCVFFSKNVVIWLWVKKRDKRKNKPKPVVPKGFLFDPSRHMMFSSTFMYFQDQCFKSRSLIEATGVYLLPRVPRSFLAPLMFHSRKAFGMQLLKHVLL